MKQKHQNSLYLLPMALFAITVTMCNTTSKRQPAPKAKVTCSLADGTQLPIEQDSDYIGNIYSRIPKKLIDSMDIFDAQIRIKVPVGVHFKLMLMDNSKIYLNEKSTFYIPFKGDAYSHIGIDGEAFLSLEKQESDSLYQVTAGPYARIRYSHGKLHINTLADTPIIAMLTAEGRIEMVGAVIPQIGPMRALHIIRNNTSLNWPCLDIDSNYRPAFAAENIVFNDAPFEKVARFLEDYYHIQVVIQKEKLRSELVTLAIHPREFSLEAACEIIKSATRSDCEITEGKVTFL